MTKKLHADHNFDVIVIGAGPAGGKCALELAKLGIKVLLVEKFQSFEENNFSSAGMLTETIDDFSIPKEIIGTHWSNFVIQSSEKCYSWKSLKKEGVVLEFSKLKQYLADECQKHGGKVWLGHRFERKEITNTICAVFTNIKTNKTVYCSAKLLVDATGPARKVMFNKNDLQPKMLVGTGIEYLIEVSDEVYKRFKYDLTFFLGEKWADRGYSWIFPMNDNRLKVGAARLVQKGALRKDLKAIIENIIEGYIQAGDYRTIDIHGGSIRYSQGMKDVFYRNRVLAIGDAVSTINPLGGEGIRYALENGEMAVPYIEKFLKTGMNRFWWFKFRWKRKYYFKWLICEILSLRVYRTYTDQKIDKRLTQYHQMADIEDLKNTFFRFSFSHFKWKIFTVLLKNLSKGVIRLG